MIIDTNNTNRNYNNNVTSNSDSNNSSYMKILDSDEEYKVTNLIFNADKENKSHVQ